jgi:hypothetical protein
VDKNNNIDKFELKTKKEAAYDILGNISLTHHENEQEDNIYIWVSVNVFFSQILAGQELNCNVQVSAQKIQGSNRQVFITMQRDIYEFYE